MIRLDDRYDEHPKIAGLSDEAFRFWHRGLAWAMRNLSDGFVPVGVARQLAGRRTKKLTDELVTAKLWEVKDGGWSIHDILDWNWSKEEALAYRASARDQRVSAGQARARGPRGKGGRFTSGTSEGTSEGTSSGTSGAASELTSEKPAHSHIQYPIAKERPGLPSEGLAREELTARVEATFAKSQHADAFTGKRDGLLALIQKYPGRDVERAAEDLVRRVDLIQYDSKALTLYESFIQKAPRVEPPEPSFHCSACHTSWSNADRCRRLELGGVDGKPGDVCDDPRDSREHCFNIPKCRIKRRKRAA